MQPHSAASLTHTQQADAKVKTRAAMQRTVVGTLKNLRQSQRAGSQSRLYAAVSDKSRAFHEQSSEAALREKSRSYLSRHLDGARWRGIEQLPLRKTTTSTASKEVEATSKQSAVLAMKNLGLDLLNLDSASSKGAVSSSSSQHHQQRRVVAGDETEKMKENNGQSGDLKRMSRLKPYVMRPQTAYERTHNSLVTDAHRDKISAKKKQVADYMAEKQTAGLKRPKSAVPLTRSANRPDGEARATEGTAVVGGDDQDAPTVLDHRNDGVDGRAEPKLRGGRRAQSAHVKSSKGVVDRPAYSPSMKQSALCDMKFATRDRSPDAPAADKERIEGLAGEHPSNYNRGLYNKLPMGAGPVDIEPTEDPDLFYEESEQYRKEDQKKAMQAYVKRKMEGKNGNKKRPQSASASRIKSELKEVIDDDDITSLFCENTKNVLGAAKKYANEKKPKRPSTAGPLGRRAEQEDPLKVTRTWLCAGDLPVHPATMERQNFLRRCRSAHLPRRASQWGPGPKTANALEPVIDKRLDIPNLTFDSLQDPGSKFRKMFERGDLPIAIKHGAKMTLEWRIPVESINTRIFLPIFIDGIRERKFPFNYVSFEGTMSMIKSLNEERLLSALPEAMQSIHRNMVEKDRNVICKCIKVLRELVPRGPAIGEAMIPHYKLFLPILNLFVCEWRNLGDEMDFAQRHEDGRNIAIMSQELLQLLERAAPDAAFFNIKYAIPTYESCLQ
eukprot:g16860.t1